jgi:mono/diheme cytochrome c family protein
LKAAPKREKGLRPRIDASVMMAAFAALAVICGAARTQDIFAGGYPQRTGEELYKGICQGCHMPDAKGAVGAGAYPALANDNRLIGAIYPITVVLNGQRAMPSFGDDLSDAQIADVVNYIRTHFGNHYKDAVSPAAVKAARRSK